MSNQSDMSEMNKEPIKTYVLDTTVLIYDPDVMFKASEAEWVIPLAVIREIDGLKNSDKELVAKAARQIARTLDRFGSYGDLIAGVKLPTGRTLRVFTRYESVDALASDADNKILGAALSLKNAGEDVTLFTTDTNMRTVARAYGLKAEYTPFYDIEIPQASVARSNRMNSEDKEDGSRRLPNQGGARKISPEHRDFTRVLMRICFAVAIIGFIAVFFTPKAFYDTVNMITGFALTGGIALMVYRAGSSVSYAKRIRYRGQDFFLDPNWSSDPGNVWHKKDDC